MRGMSVQRTKAEYGGFLPLELNPGEEFFDDYESSLCRFNSVKAALDFLIKRLGLKRIYIPYYYCPSTTEAIRKTGIEVRFYHIDERLAPIDLPDESQSMVLLVDYFGVCSSHISELAKKFCSAEVIIDRAHGFYAEPIIDDHIHNVYSAKKFLGIPDGAYLISKAVIPCVEIPVDACGYAEYLLTTYEKGTDAAYRMKKNVDVMLGANYGCMSKLSIGLLKNVDYDRVKRSREDNYRVFYDAFKNMNELSLPMKSAAYQFPLLISCKGKVIKQKLIEEHIFVSTLWSGKDLIENGNIFELNMMENAIFLPIDQRYNVEDMEYIISRVEAIMEDKCDKE